MTLTKLALGPVLAAALLVPAAALAGVAITINPERLDGEDFTFFDLDQGINNQLVFDVDGPEFMITGAVFGSAGPDNVTIQYQTDYPNDASASKQEAAVSQSTQVRVTLIVDFSDPMAVDYSRQAAPEACSASAKIRDNEANDPDDPDNSQASVSCELGNDLEEFEPEAQVPEAVLVAVQQAFAGRKDVKIDVQKGKLSIKHKGQAGDV